MRRNTTAKTDQSATHIPVTYIGAKEHGVTDRKFGTDLVWSGPGDVQHVPPAAAAAMCLHHPDVWADARTEKQQQKDPLVDDQERPTPEEEEDPREFRPLADLSAMSHEQLIEFAMREFNMDMSEFDQPTIIDKLSVQVGGQRFK